MQTQADFYEIYDYYSQPLLETTSIKILLVVCVLSLMLLFAFLFLRRKRRQITVWELAINELALLNPELCTSKNEYKAFYFKLTGILKKYLNQLINQ